MNLEELESQTRAAIEQALNQLQTVTLLASELENRISQTGQSVQELSQLIETYVISQRNQ